MAGIEIPDREIGGSVERVRAALVAAGHPDTIVEFPAGTRTAADAAAAVGCKVAQIAKSIVFRCDAGSVVVITSGANRVDPAKVEAALGIRLDRADAEWIRQTTGFSIGGIAPIGHLTPPIILIDEDLMEFDLIWAAAGSPNHVFRTSASELCGSPGRRDHYKGRLSLLSRRAALRDLPEDIFLCLGPNRTIAWRTQKKNEVGGIAGMTLWS